MKWNTILLIAILINLFVGNMAQRERENKILKQVYIIKHNYMKIKD